MVVFCCRCAMPDQSQRFTTRATCHLRSLTEAPSLATCPTLSTLTPLYHEEVHSAISLPGMAWAQ